MKLNKGSKSELRYLSLKTDIYVYIYISRVKVSNRYTWFFSPQLLRLRGTSEKYDTVIGKVINRVQANVVWYKKQKNEVIVEFDWSKSEMDSIQSNVKLHEVIRPSH